MKVLLDDPTSNNISGGDKQYLQMMQEREEFKLPEGARGLPNWGPKNAKNARGVCPASAAHYTGLACVDGTFIEVTLDSGGARTMIDEHTARLLKLDVEWAADTNKYYGTFTGING
jgi:hypothetical protein